MDRVLATCCGLLILATTACQPVNSSNDAADVNMGAERNANGAEAASRGADSRWTYSAERDEARGSEVKFASVTSSNTEHFDFPYQGGSQAVMTLRRHPEWGLDVYFTVRPGQMVCGIRGCSALVNIDGRQQHVSLTTPADHSSDTLFVLGAARFINRLKNSRRVIVELPFYREGQRQFTFETAGLRMVESAAPVRRRR
ncbi:MAG TPA: hypothetical protein VGB79_00060 [Allosphingosinicella sp.]|jgi:hypothetical protein